MTPLRTVLAPFTRLEWWKRTAPRLRMHSLPLRRWLVLSLALLIFLPILTGSITAVILNLRAPESGRSAEHVLGESLDSWDDPVWRAESTAELHERGIEFALYVNGREIYRSVPNPNEGRDYPGGVQQFDFDDDHMALIYRRMWGPSEENDDEWPVPVVAIATLIATFVGMGIFFGRTVVKPLAATSAAAGDIAGGDLAISLPGSRVREVSELNAAIEGMASTLADSLSREAQIELERRFLIGAVAHDLRTPLFALRGSLEAISTGIADTEEKRERYLKTAQDKAAALDRLISDLFDFARFGLLEQAPDRQLIDIGNLVHTCVDAMRSRAGLRSIEIDVRDETADIMVLADPLLVTRAIDNILDNAIRYSREHSSVQVCCSREAFVYHVSVTDTGPGISVEDLPHIFDPMFRGESSRNRASGGAGLGLTIAYRVLLAHGGGLVAQNLDEGGAVFIVSLPIAR